MIEGKVVKVRFRKAFAEQKMWVFIGRVTKFTENWLMLEGRGMLVAKGQLSPVDIDEQIRTIMVPRDNVGHIRVLPDDFDIMSIEIEIKGIRIYAKVEGGPFTSISEI